VTESCTWCGTEVEADDGFRAYELAGERRATFCRLEHVVPWALDDAHWEAGGPTTEPPDTATHESTCSHCGAELGETQVILIRHRGEARIGDGFCSVDHLNAWAKAGGRFQ
jgi:hypothetical protein